MGARPGGFGGEGNWFDRSADPVERELAFETPDERLPWLESDEEGDEPPVYDTGRLVGLGRSPQIPTGCTNGQKSQILPKSCVPMALKP